MRRSLEANLETLLENKTGIDEFINFESLGIDMLFVDEAHGYKNVRPMTRLGNRCWYYQPYLKKEYGYGNEGAHASRRA